MSILHARGRRIGAAAVAVILSVAALSGCTKSPNDAAEVNGTAISRDQLEQATSAAAVTLGNDSINQTQVASLLIQGTVADQLASQRNISITDGDRDSVKVQISQTETTTVGALIQSHPVAEPLLYDYANLQIMLAKSGEQELTSAIQSARISLNPRYGRWDPSRSLAVIADDGSLSQVLQQSTP